MKLHWPNEWHTKLHCPRSVVRLLYVVSIAWMFDVDWCSGIQLAVHVHNFLSWTIVDWDFTCDSLKPGRGTARWGGTPTSSPWCRNAFHVEQNSHQLYWKATTETWQSQDMHPWSSMTSSSCFFHSSVSPLFGLVPLQRPMDTLGLSRSIRDTDGYRTIPEASRSL